MQKMRYFPHKFSVDDAAANRKTKPLRSTFYSRHITVPVGCISVTP